jgi:hypothetical protein
MQATPYKPMRWFFVTLCILAIVVALVVVIPYLWHLATLPLLTPHYYPKDDQVFYRTFPALPGETDVHYYEVQPDVATAIIEGLRHHSYALHEGEVATLELKIGNDSFYMYSDGFISTSPGASLERGWRIKAVERLPLSK